MFPLELSYPNTTFPEYANIAEVEGKDLKAPCVKIRG